MSSTNDQDKSLSLIDAIDELLVQVETTTKSYAPPEEPVVDANMMITDDGTVMAAPEPESSDETEEDQEAETEAVAPEDEPIDSIVNAEQALEALEDVESQAEELVSQSIDALLENTEAVVESEQSAPETEPATEPESATEPEAETTATDKAEPEAEVEAEVEVEVEVEAEPVAEAEDKPVAETETEPVTEASPDPELEAEAVVEEAIESPPTEEPAADVGETLDENLSDAIGSLIDDAPAEEAQAEEIEEPAATQESMDMLDDALAQAADDMLEGDFETEDGELVSGDAVASAIEEALDQPTAESETSDDDILGSVVDDLLGSPEETPAPSNAAQTPTAQESAATSDNPAPDGASSKATPEIAAQITEEDHQRLADILDIEEEVQGISVPAWFEQTIELLRPPLDKIDPFKGKSMDVVAMTLGSIIVAFLTYARPAAARGVIIVSKPLSKQSVEIRNAVGYIALWTGFLAVVIWVYLLVFRTPSIPQPDVAPTRVINAANAGQPVAPIP